MEVRASVLPILWLTLAPAIAGAQVESAWDLAEGCATEEEAGARAAALLRGAPVASLDVTIDRGEGAYAARFTLSHEGAEAERRLEDIDCQALVDAVVVLVALALGMPPPSLEVAAPAPAPEALVGPLDPPEVAHEHVVEPDAPPPPGPRLAALIGAGGFVESALPSPPLGVALEGGLAYDALRVTLGVRWLPAMEWLRGETQGATFWGVLGALRGGAMAVVAEGDAGRLELGGGGRFELGVVHGEGFGVVEPETGDGLWVALGGDAELAWWIEGPFGISLAAGLSVPLVRPLFVLDSRPLFSVGEAGARVALRAWLALE